MPATVIEASLRISCVFSDGRTAEFHLDGLPCRELLLDLLFGLVELIHPHGSIDAAHSVDNALPAIRQLAGHLADHGFTGGASELRRGQLIEYWMATRVFRWENGVRRMLRGFDTATGRLDPDVRSWSPGGHLRRYRTALRCRPTPKPNGIGWSAPAAPSSMTPTARTNTAWPTRTGAPHRLTRDGPRTIWPGCWRGWDRSERQEWRITWGAR